MSKLGYSQRIRLRIAELERDIKAAQDELQDLYVAERVLNRLGSANDEKEQEVGQSRTPTTKEPTIGEMAVKFLSREGPLDTVALLGVMRKEWRPDLPQTTLSSTLSRVKASGQIEQINGTWRISQTADTGVANIADDDVVSDTSWDDSDQHV